MVRRRPVLTFFILACAFSWPGFFLFFAGKAGAIPLKVPAELAFASEYGPTAMGILLTFWLRGGAGVKALLARGLRWRVGLQWYLAALFITAGLFAIDFGLQALFGKPFPGFAPLGDWGPRFAERLQGFTPSLGLISGAASLAQKGTAWVAAAALFFFIESGGITEEFGWRGFALAELQGRHGALRAGMTVGLMWALWHLCPVHLFLTENFRDALLDNFDHYKWYILEDIPLGVLFAWVYNNTGGSVLIAILFHAAFNATNTAVNGAWPDFCEGYWFMGTMWAVTAAIVWWFGPAALVRGSRENRSAAGLPSRAGKSPVT